MYAGTMKKSLNNVRGDDEEVFKYMYFLQISAVFEPALGFLRRNGRKHGIPNNKIRMNGGFKVTRNQLRTSIITISPNPSLDAGKGLLYRI
jgi:hypothetical protein